MSDFSKHRFMPYQLIWRLFILTRVMEKQLVSLTLKSLIIRKDSRAQVDQHEKTNVGFESACLRDSYSPVKTILHPCPHPHPTKPPPPSSPRLVMCQVLDRMLLGRMLPCCASAHRVMQGDTGTERVSTHCVPPCVFPKHKAEG